MGRWSMAFVPIYPRYDTPAPASASAILSGVETYLAAVYMASGEDDRTNITSTEKTTDSTNLTGEPVPTQTTCECTSSVNPIDALKSLLEFLIILQKTFVDFYVSTNVNSPLVADMSVGGFMSFRLHSRIVWSKQHPGVKFNPTSITDINALKDIYLSYNVDWQTDDFLVMQTLILGLY